MFDMCEVLVSVLPRHRWETVVRRARVETYVTLMHPVVLSLDTRNRYMCRREKGSVKRAARFVLGCKSSELDTVWLLP